MKAEDLVFNQQQSREVLVHGFTEHYRTQSGCSLHRNPLGHTAVLFLGLLPLFCVKLQGYLRLISSGWAFFLSSLFLMSCSLRWLLQVLHTVTGRMQHKASVLPVPQRGQRTAGKRHKQFNLSGRKLKSKDSQRENEQDIFQLLVYLPFLHPISAIFHRDVGFCVPTNIQSDNCESRSFLTPTSKVVSSFAKKKEVSRGNSSGRGSLLCQTDYTVETLGFTQLRTRGTSCVAGPPAVVQAQLTWALLALSNPDTVNIGWTSLNKLPYKLNFKATTVTPSPKSSKAENSKWVLC